MAKAAYVYSGTDWVPLASEVTNLSGYYTKGETDIITAPTGLKLLVPTSVAVGSGTGTVATTGTVTFTGASSVSLNDVFSTTYDNYKIVLSGLISTSAQEINLRLRVSGSDNSTASSYVKNQINGNDTSVTGIRTTSNLISFGAFDTTLVNSQTIEICNPFLASATGFISLTNRSTSGAISHLGTGTHNQTTSYTGFTIFPAANNLTGTVSVYGYKK
jgi:hypothetical protein